MSASAREQSALRRIADLVAGSPTSAELFDALVAETAGVLGVPVAALGRYAGDGAVAVLSGAWPPGGRALAETVRERGRAVRIATAVAVPIVLDGEVWGVICAGGVALSDGAEDRLGGLGALAALAISCVDADERLRRVADAQGALRRVTALVGEGVSAAELFESVVREVARVINVASVLLLRYERDRATTVVSSLNAPGFAVGSWWPLDGPSVAATVLQTGRPARLDDYSELDGTIAAQIRDSGIPSWVGVPIVVDGRVWGLICAGAGEPLPDDIDLRLRDFTALLALSIASVEARARPRRLAEQQASLRRVATLVAEGAAPAAVFAAVAEEVVRILDVSAASVMRYEPDNTSVVVASVNDPGLPVGSRWPLDGASLAAAVHETGRPARVDDYTELGGPAAAAARVGGIESGVGVPIIVDGRVWGMVAVGRRRRREALPSFTGSYTGRIVLSTETPQGIETRLADFTELVATAISNATARAELIASRARIVEAADDTRRRIQRDLHDGAQQSLVHTVITLKLAQEALDAEGGPAVGLVDEALEHAERASTELRELAHGILPSALGRGLGPAVETLVSRVRLPVSVDVTGERLAPEVEATAYFIVAEALTNAMKHARASKAEVTAAVEDGVLHVRVRDDGAGGAAAGAGSGLVGLRDRVEALGGRFAIDSPQEGGTTISVEVPT
jgi:signal transduction histidine kinase